MDIMTMLDELRIQSAKKPEWKKLLLATRQDKQPLHAFCEVCQKLGYPIYEMDILAAEEEFYAAIKRSTNGGGENSPVLKGEDDLYALFLAELEG